MAKFWLSKLIFYVKNYLNFFFIEEYDVRSKVFYWNILKTSIFKPLYFLKLRPIFDDFYSTDRKTQKLFKELVVGFGPEGMPGRICNIVR